MSKDFNQRMSIIRGKVGNIEYGDMCDTCIGNAWTDIRVGQFQMLDELMEWSGCEVEITIRKVTE